MNYQEIFKIVLKEKQKGIPIKDTLEKLTGSRHNANFYKNITIKQRTQLTKARELTEKQKTEFMDLYLNKRVGASVLARKYRIRTKKALDFANTLTTDYKRSRQNHDRKLTKYQVIKIIITYAKYGNNFSRWNEGITQKELAIKYNIEPCNVNNILHGRSWKHIFQGAKKKYNKEILSITEKERILSNSL